MHRVGATSGLLTFAGCGSGMAYDSGWARGAGERFGTAEVKRADAASPIARDPSLLRGSLSIRKMRRNRRRLGRHVAWIGAAEQNDSPACWVREGSGRVHDRYVLVLSNDCGRAGRAQLVQRSGATRVLQQLRLPVPAPSDRRHASVGGTFKYNHECAGRRIQPCPSEASYHAWLTPRTSAGARLVMNFKSDVPVSTVVGPPFLCTPARRWRGGAEALMRSLPRRRSRSWPTRPLPIAHPCTGPYHRGTCSAAPPCQWTKALPSP